MSTPSTQPQAPQAEPAIHVCRFPVPQAKPFPRSFGVAFPAQEPWTPGAVALAALLLPARFSIRRYDLLPDDLDIGIVPMWSEPTDSPLLLPPDAVADRRIRAEWGAAAFASLEDLGIPFPTEAVSEVAWWVLARMPRVTLIERLAELALIVDVNRSSATVLEALVTTMKLPPSLEGRLAAHVRADAPLFHPRAVLWILREIAAADATELARTAKLRPGFTSDFELLAHSLFPAAAAGGTPDEADLLRAVWLLHQAFHGFDDPGTGELSNLMSMTAALGFRFNRTGHWSRLLEQRLKMWLTPDDHPNVTGAQVAPSAARAGFAAAFGIPADQWLAGVWGLCARWVMSARPNGGHIVSGDPADLFAMPFDDDPIPFNDAFIAGFRRNCVTTLEDLRAACRKHGGADGYQGLGSLPQTDSLATRNAPVLELPDGRLIPLGVELVAERAVDVHRLEIGIAAAGRATAPLFEAYVNDQLAELAPRVRVVGEAELKTATPLGRKRADALVVDGWDCLSIEMSIQTMPRGIAAGHPAAITRMAQRYQDEADQAIATIEDLPTTQAALGLPRLQSAAFLVVTDTAIAHSPAFLRILAELRPGRPAKFLCTASDIDLLVGLAMKGWSVATAIASWQAGPGEGSLSEHLHRMAAITGLPPVRDETFVARWLDHLPRRTSSGAAPAA